MSLARVALRNFQHRVASYQGFSERTLHSAQNQRWNGSELVRRISTSAREGSPESKEVEVSHPNKKSKLFPRRKQRRSLWRKDHDHEDFPPSLSEMFPTGLGNALAQATENINRLLGKLSPSRLMGRMKEQDDCYKLRYYVPGLGKDDIKVTVEDRTLIIKGAREEMEESEDEDDNWSGYGYFGYYDAAILLPDDAKADEIKAEMKNGVLTIIIPRTETPKKDFKEIPVH